VVLALVRQIMMVYVSAGDVALKLKEMRFLSDADSSQPAAHHPTVFDRIHLSHIPHYLRMDLITFIRATPLLKAPRPAFATYNCVTHLPPQIPLLIIRRGHSDTDFAVASRILV
jgi:hypothetical protein